MKRLIIFALTAMLFFSACAQNKAQEEETDTYLKDESAAVRIDYDGAFGIALNALASFPEADWSSVELNSNWLDYTSKLDGEAYNFVFSRSGCQVRCTVDTLSGEVTESECLPVESVGTVPVQDETADEIVLASALEYFGIDRSEVENITVEYEKDKSPESRWYYVGFTFDGTDYKCEIDSDGEFYTSNVDIGPRGSVSLAMNDFCEHIDSLSVRDGLKNLILAGESYDMISGSSEENGLKKYRVSFKTGGYGINYLISEAGKIIDYSIESIDGWNGMVVEASYSVQERLSEHQALKIAIEDAQFDVGNLKKSDVVYNDNYGYGFYSVSFGSDVSSYYYEIDAYSGKILKSEK